MPARAEVLFHGQHLPHRQVVFAEQFVVTVDEFGLPYGGKQLAPAHAVRLARGSSSQFAPPARHGTGGNQYDFDAVLPQLGHLVYQGRHARHVQRPVVAGQDGTSYLDDYAFVLPRHEDVPSLIPSPTPSIP